MKTIKRRKITILIPMILIFIATTANCQMLSQVPKDGNTIGEKINSNMDIFTGIPNSAAAPNLVKMKINDEAISRGEKVTVEQGSNFTVRIEVTTDCSLAKIVLRKENWNSDNYTLSYLNTQFWECKINTADFLGKELWDGTYSFIFFLTGNEGTNGDNDPEYIFENIIEIVPNRNNFIPIVVAIVIVLSCAVALGIFIIRRRKTEREKKVVSANEPKKREKIYTGASQLGKMSGSAAESWEKSRAIKVPESNIGTKTISVGAASGKLAEVSNPAYLKKLPSSMQMKLAERGMGVIKRAQFLGSKIDSLLSQIDILKSIIGMGKPEGSCPICGKKIGVDWEFCPFCRTDSLGDEINMKRATLDFGPVKSICPDCGLMQNTVWIKCPRCLTESGSQP